MAATIKFGDYEFDATGTPQFGQRIDFEQQGDGLPRIARTTYTIKQTFTEQSFADNEAQIHLLNNALAAGEGVLLVKDENGSEIVNQVVKIKSHNVPESWRQYVADVTVTFEGRGLVAATQVDASFTPSGGVPIVLPNIQDFKQATDTQRFNEERSNRKTSRVNISASGFLLADKTLSLASRRQALQQMLNQLRGCNCKEGTLAYAGENNVVRIEKLDGDIADGSERLNWSLSCFFQVFPTGDAYAEVDYNVSTRDDFQAGRRYTSARGNIRAADEATGKAKAESIRLQFASASRVSEHADLGDSRLDGADGSTWVDMTFDYQFSEPLAQTSYEIRVSTKTDVKSDDNIISYQGKVTSSDSTAAFAQARQLGFGKYPLMISSEEVLASKKSGVDQNEIFVEVTFNYEYQTKSDWKYAEITRDTSSDRFGDSREIVSGFAVALTESDAREFADAFKLSGRLMRDQKETSGSKIGQAATATGATSQMTRFDFSYQYYLTPASVSVSYGREEKTDYATSESTIAFSGVARGPSEVACRSFISQITADTPGRLTETSRTPSFERQAGVNTSGSAGAGAQLVSVAFSDRFVGVPAGGPDVLQAEFSMKKVFSVNKAVLTPIPYDHPFVQNNVGWTAGMVTISGSVTARSAITAQTWGRAKRALLGSNGCENAPEEDAVSINAPMDALQIKQYRFNFTYSARYQYLPFA